MKPRDLNCQSCGACCGPGADYETYVQLIDHDLVRLGRSKHVHHGRASIKTKRSANGCVCSALYGHVGEAVRCGIYSTRPTLCREFEPGGVDCLVSRENAGIS